IQKPGAPDTLLRMSSAPFGMRIMRRARLVHLGAGRLHPFVQDDECARIAIDWHTERLRHAVGGDVTVGRPDPALGEDIGAAIDDRSLLIADHPHFTAQGEILSGGPKDQNIGYCRVISDGGRHRLAGQLRLQLEAAIEAARATNLAPKESPRIVTYGGPDESQTRTKAPQLKPRLRRSRNWFWWVSRCPSGLQRSSSLTARAWRSIA